MSKYKAYSFAYAWYQTFSFNFFRFSTNLYFMVILSVIFSARD